MCESAIVGPDTLHPGDNTYFKLETLGSYK